MQLEMTNGDSGGVSEPHLAVGDWVSCLGGLVALSEGPAKVLNVYMMDGEWKARLKFLDGEEVVATAWHYFKPPWTDDDGNPTSGPDDSMFYNRYERFRDEVADILACDYADMAASVRLTDDARGIEVGYDLPDGGRISLAWVGSLKWRTWTTEWFCKDIVEALRQEMARVTA